MADTFKLVKLLDGININIDSDGLLNNYAATAAPTVTDDSSSGYAVGSKWVDVTNDEAYILADATVGAAVWLNISSLEELDAHIADTSIHFTEGSIDHTAISNIGTNSHAQIDTHIADSDIHVDHTGVDIATGANSGLGGGGDISSTRSLVADPNNATSASVAAGDEVIFSDVSDSNNLKKDTVQGIIDLFQDNINRVQISSDTTISFAAHAGSLLEVSGDRTLTLPDNLPANMQFMVVPTTSGQTIIIRTDPANASTFNGVVDGSFTLIASANSGAYVWVRAVDEYRIIGDIVAT